MTFLPTSFHRFTAISFRWKSISERVRTGLPIMIGTVSGSCLLIRCRTRRKWDRWYSQQDHWQTPLCVSYFAGLCIEPHWFRRCYAFVFFYHSVKESKELPSLSTSVESIFRTTCPESTNYRVSKETKVITNAREPLDATSATWITFVRSHWIRCFDNSERIQCSRTISYCEQHDI